MAAEYVCEHFVDIYEDCARCAEDDACYEERDRQDAWSEMEDLHELWDCEPEQDWRTQVKEFLDDGTQG